jgi:hypothetical protein
MKLIAVVTEKPVNLVRYFYQNFYQFFTFEELGNSQVALTESGDSVFLLLLRQSKHISYELRSVVAPDAKEISADLEASFRGFVPDIIVYQFPVAHSDKTMHHLIDVMAEKGMSHHPQKSEPNLIPKYGNRIELT